MVLLYTERERERDLDRYVLYVRFDTYNNDVVDKLTARMSVYDVELSYLSEIIR